MLEIPASAAVAKRRRDALGQFCFALHFGVMAFIVIGWAIPQTGILILYLVLLPGIILQWQFNKNSCVLNNVESLIRTGRWRDPGNVEEGAWFAGLIRRVLRLELKPVHLEIFIYGVMALFWTLALHHALHM